VPYFSGQGKLYVADRDAEGYAKGFKYLGNVPSLAVNLTTDQVEHQESTSGQRLVDAVMIAKKSAEVQFDIEEFTANNIARALFGVSATITGTSVTGESLNAVGLVAGDFFQTKNPKISAVAVKASAGSPATLTLGTDYAIDSADHGTIKLLNAGSYVQPFKVDYTFATYSNVPMFTEALVDRWLKFDGLNTVDSNRAVRVELYKFNLYPMESWNLLSNDFAKWTIKGRALYDAAHAADSVLGGFGRVLFIS